MAIWNSDKYSIGYNIIEKAAPYDFVVLNGNLATHRWWHPSLEQVKTLWPKTSELTGRIIFLELPGCGESPAIDTVVSIPNLISTYTELLQNLKLNDNARIMGHSTGGLLACHLMAQTELKFAKSLLLDPVGPSGIQFDDSVLNTYEEMKANKELTAAIIAFTILNCDTTTDFFKNVILEDTFKSVKGTGSLMIQALRGLDSTSIYKNIKTPITVLFGDQDILLPKQDAEKITQLVPNSEFILLEGVGHCLNAENPKKMGQMIFEHLT
jgi:3-oxoadipate enol-lactonase